MQPNQPEKYRKPKRPRQPRHGRPEEYKQKDFVLKMIRDAFDGVELGSGVSMHETQVLDDYGTDKERKEARAKDPQADWRVLLKDEDFKKIMSSGWGGMSFLDADGFRFHLPAAMILAIEQPELELVESLIFHLTQTDAHGLKKFSALSRVQKRCVKHVLKFLRHNTGNRLGDIGHKDIDRALEAYWKRQ